ncbi:chromosomal replication initiator protein DnaA [Candidatus Endowatersipora endosymbiont of Watersipora subatra]|uniref:chromosomal replication initiator protein DnaA n=1 Tax=Candidatus Endowatersipora endosymbiont of Watersipora subatra TaxID=3077946 RepID=UPI00312C78E2
MKSISDRNENQGLCLDSKSVPLTQGNHEVVPKTSIKNKKNYGSVQSTILIQNRSIVSTLDIQKWKRVQVHLKSSLGLDVFTSWFSRCRLEEISKFHLTLSVPTIFLKSWIKIHYKKLLLELWQKENEDILRLHIVVRSALRSTSYKRNSEKETTMRIDTQNADHQILLGNIETENCHRSFAKFLSNENRNKLGMSHRISQDDVILNPLDHNSDPKDSGFSGSPLDSSFTFSTFVEGKSNRMVFSAAKSIAESDGSALPFNPLFIHSSVGLGKTHLLQAVAWKTTERNSNAKILYLTAEYFMWHFTSSLRDHSAISFKETLRDIDLLLIDDMQFLQRKSIHQQEFCYLLNVLIDNAKQVVVAADRSPSMLESLDERVKSRLKGGVALEIKSPELEMRREMLETLYREARKDDPLLDLSTDVLNFVSEKVSSSGRDLEGAFKQLLIQHRFSDRSVEVDFLDKMLGHLVQSNEQKRVRIEDIQKIVARHYNVTKNDLLSNRRTRIIVRPRQIAMFLSKLLTPRSLPEIGRRFGGRDHTTVIHAVRKIETLLGEDKNLLHDIELLKRLIRELGQ